MVVVCDTCLAMCLDVVCLAGCSGSGSGDVKCTCGYMSFGAVRCVSGVRM